MLLHVDLETSSEADLKTVGLDVYAHHPSTKILMLAYAFDDRPVEQWQPHLGPMPEDLSSALRDPAVTKVAWNVTFEFTLLTAVLGIPLVLTQWYDPMAHSRYLGLPGALDGASRVLDLGADQGKSKEGKRLIKMFSIQTRATKKTPAHFKNWETNPTEWQEFLNYNRQDIVAERVLMHRLAEIGEFPASEYRAWVLSELINQRGVPVDMAFVGNALALAEKESVATLGEMQRITQLANPNSGPQMRGWFEAQGCPMESLDKEHVVEALKNVAVAEAPRQVLLLKQRLGGSAPKKLVAFRDRTRDGRLRDGFQYFGAHTGRWASWGAQLHNMKRPSPRVKEFTDEITTAILRGHDLNLLGIPIVACIGETLRSSFRAPAGSRFMVSDLSQIENRVLAWMAGCPAMLQVYADGLCAYRSFAMKMYGKAYGDITADERQRSKPITLGCGFGMGSRKLQAYAATMGVVMSEEEAQGHVDLFRETYPEIPAFWYNLGGAAMQAVQQFCRLRLGRLLIDGTNPEMLTITLPSGRLLHYQRPAVVQDHPEWPEKTILVFEGMAKSWSVLKTRGSKLVENCVQACARDILVHAMMLAHKRGFQLVLHCHDEMVSLTQNDSPLMLADFTACMVAPPAWSEGLPLAAESFECDFYRKEEKKKEGA